MFETYIWQLFKETLDQYVDEKSRVCAVIPYLWTKTDKESGNSGKIRVRGMHCIEMDLEGIAVFFIRFCIPFKPGGIRSSTVFETQTQTLLKVS